MVNLADRGGSGGGRRGFFKKLVIRPGRK